MKLIDDEIVLKNKRGKAFHIYMNSCLLLLIIYLYFESGHLFVWPFTFTFYSAFFAFKSVKVTQEGIKVKYHFRPFFREINCPVQYIRKISFNLYRGGTAYRNMSFFLSKYPYLFEIRLDKKDDVEPVFELLCDNGKFKIKPKSDKRVMRKRLIKITANSECKVL